MKGLIELGISNHLNRANSPSCTVVSSQTLYPVGAIFSFSGTPPTDYGFTGQKRDATANLMYYGARYYDAALGRFIQPDTIVPNPMDPQSLNRYSYVRNNPVNRIDPTGHEDCAAEDDWCWQNRWYEAHGYCWSDAKQDWAKQCEPEFQDPDILNEVLGEEGGLEIVKRADPFKVLGLLLQGFLQQRIPTTIPNILILGVTVSGNFYAGYGAISTQWVFDFKHNQIRAFVSPALGGGAGLGFSFGIQFGIGWCNAECHSVDAFSGSFAGGGGTLSASDVGVGLDYQESGKFGNSAPSVVQTLMFDVVVGIGTPEGHLASSYSVPLNNTFYSFPGNDRAMFFQTFTIVYQYTLNTNLAGLYASYAFVVDEQP